MGFIYPLTGAMAHGVLYKLISLLVEADLIQNVCTGIFTPTNT